jgi:hypothetical protein
LAASGIKKIYYIEDYKNDELIETLKNEWKIEINKLKNIKL